MQKIIYSIGHSTRSLHEFVEMLQAFEIELLADIRSYPGSRRYPHFNKENLAIELPENSISYIHIPSLGGRRKTFPGSKNTAWKNEAFRGYADYMETESFIKAMNQLEKMAVKNKLAYMCAEAVWWSCHRSLVSDYLKIKGWKVMHIMNLHKADEHPYTAAAKIIDGKLNYTALQKDIQF